MNSKHDDLLYIQYNFLIYINLLNLHRLKNCQEKSRKNINYVKEKKLNNKESFFSLSIKC